VTDGTSRRTIALVDDHVLIVDGLAQWLETNAPDFDVVAVSGSWTGLVEHESFPPDVVIMARQMDSTPTLLRRVRECKDAGAAVVVMSTDGGREAETETLAAGADAFVPKSRPAEAVLDAVKRVLGDAEAAASGPCPRVASPIDEPDDWQKRVLRLYSAGQSTVDIALIEGVRFEKIRTALKAIRASYDQQGRRADTRDELLRRAAEDGYLTDPDAR
jgi:DNA-binding NarL/FixJ family response regulator